MDNILSNAFKLFLKPKSLEEKMKKMKESLASQKVSIDTPLVQVVMNGERKVLSIKIKTQIKGREELQESLKEAVNRAADEVQRKTVSKIMKEFHIDPSLLP